MKIKLPTLFIILFVTVLLSKLSLAQNLDSTNLPIVILNTYGQFIQDDPPITIFMGIIDNGFGNMNHISDPYTDFNAEVIIEIRGSTSQQYPKESYAFSPIDGLGNHYDYPILGMPAENDWILYGPYPDKTLIRNKLTYTLASKMGHYSSRAKFVEVVRNGQYLGVYELQEKIKRDLNRVNIAKLTQIDTAGIELTGGYIIKIDKTTGSGNEIFYSSYDPEIYFQYHYPKDTEILLVQKNYIISYIDSFETALMSPGFSDPITGFRKYADEKSFIDFFILQELGHTVDGYRSSCFLHKDKGGTGGKLDMGPMWDFNLSYGNADYCSAYDTTGWQYQFNFVCSGFVPHVPFWWGRLLQDTLYQNKLRCRWEQLRSTFLRTDSINAWIDSLANYLGDAQQRNFNEWPILGMYVNWNYFVGQTYQDEVDYLKMWIEKRSIWLDNNIPGNCITVGIAENTKHFELKIAPNPSNGNFSLIFNSFVLAGTVEVFNSVGKIVYTENIINQNKKDVNLKEIAAGIYFVKVFDGEKNYTKKIVVQ